MGVTWSYSFGKHVRKLVSEKWYGYTLWLNIKLDQFLHTKGKCPL